MYLQQRETFFLLSAAPVATGLPPSQPNILFCHTSPLRVLLQYIHEPCLWSSSGSSALSLLPQTSLCSYMSCSTLTYVPATLPHVGPHLLSVCCLWLHRDSKLLFKKFSIHFLHLHSHLYPSISRPSQWVFSPASDEAFSFAAPLVAAHLASCLHPLPDYLLSSSFGYLLIPPPSLLVLFPLSR